MYAGKDFSPFDSVETDEFTFDFRKRMGDDETIIGATWYCSIAEDSETSSDEDAADHVSIPATYSGTRTTQTVSGLVSGVKYTLQAVVETDQGDTLSLWSHVLCTEPS